MMGGDAIVRRYRFRDKGTVRLAKRACKSRSLPRVRIVAGDVVRIGKSGIGLRSSCRHTR
jgi:hypothetical protein